MYSFYLERATVSNFKMCVMWNNLVSSSRQGGGKSRLSKVERTPLARSGNEAILEI